jgi:hypothetical protein
VLHLLGLLEQEIYCYKLVKMGIRLIATGQHYHNVTKIHISWSVNGVYLVLLYQDTHILSVQPPWL